MTEVAVVSEIHEVLLEVDQLRCIMIWRTKELERFRIFLGWSKEDLPPWLQRRTAVCGSRNHPREADGS